MLISENGYSIGSLTWMHQTHQIHQIHYLAPVTTHLRIHQIHYLAPVTMDLRIHKIHYSAPMTTDLRLLHLPAGLPNILSPMQDHLSQWRFRT